jgi:hypothetical protein
MPNENNITGTAWTSQQEIYDFLLRISRKNPKLNRKMPTPRKIFELCTIFYEIDIRWHNFGTHHSSTLGRQYYPKCDFRLGDLKDFWKRMTYPDSGWRLDRGKEQSKTYRTNRIISNVSEIYQQSCKKYGATQMWAVGYGYDTVGFVVADDMRSAAILAESMYPAAVVGDEEQTSRYNSGHNIKWAGLYDEQRFTGFQTEHSQKLQNRIADLEKNILDAKRKIELAQRQIDFITLNLVHFTDGDNDEI